MFRALAFILLATFGLHANAIELPPMCKRANVVPVSNAFLQKEAAMTAMAKEITPNGPTIYYDPVEFKQHSPLWQAFVLAHECAHLHLRHTSFPNAFNPRNRTEKALERQEREADCLGAFIVRQYHGISDEEVEQLAKEVEGQHISRGYQSSDNLNASQRAQLVRQCARMR